jgi:hypothetical protein
VLLHNTSLAVLHHVSKEEENSFIVHTICVVPISLFRTSDVLSLTAQEVAGKTQLLKHPDFAIQIVDATFSSCQ